jgi:flagellar biosynthesis/type III secretory pathway protein FliH
MLRRFIVASTFGVTALALASPASAQAPDWRFQVQSAQARSRIDNYGYNDVRRVAYDNGYREGLKEGEKDGRKNDRFFFEDENSFRKGDKGYQRQYGDRERYRQVFRSGYASGYEAGYRRYNTRGRYDDRGRYGDRGRWDDRGGYGGNYGGYARPAFENGARDGYEKGIEDARKNRSFDPLRHAWYRSGDRHYEGRYGARDAYKDVYRRGFQEGYERGYREARYRW